MSKFAFRAAVLALAIAGACTPALAQVAPSQITPGMQVYDAREGLVGAVSKVANGMATVVTDKHAVPVNPASFALDRGRLYLAMTRAELNAFYETNIMASEASLAVGKPVKGVGGAVLGTIKEIDEANVVITLASGQPIQLPRNSIVGAATGATVGISLDDLNRQLQPAIPTPAASPASPPAKANAAAN